MRIIFYCTPSSNHVLQVDNLCIYNIGMKEEEEQKIVSIMISCYEIVFMAVTLMLPEVDMSILIMKQSPLLLFGYVCSCVQLCTVVS